MKTKSNYTKLIPIVAFAALTACGGGGGGGATGGAAAPAVAAAPADTFFPSNFVISVPTPTFAPGSEELAAFNLLNAERTQCGFGKLAQNTQLDAAARAHADYQLRNNVDSHFENQTQFPTGFTGVDDVARMIFAGYTNVGASTDEYVVTTGLGTKTGLGERGIRNLLSAPYHMAGLLGSYRDIGMSLRNGADVSSSTTRVIFQVNPAYKTSAGPQLMGSADVLTYPCEGTTGAIRQLLNEEPNPVPGRNLATQPLGTAIYMAVREGRVLRITSSSVTKTSTGASVVMRAAIDSSNDPIAPCNRGCFQSYEAYVIPDAPLDANSRYDVVVSGTNNGTPFTRSFRFETGSN